MNKEQFINGNKESMYNIFDVVYAYLVSNYGIGIHGFKAEPWPSPGSVNKLLTFSSDGMKILQVITAGDYENDPMTEFGIVFINGQKCENWFVFKSTSDIKNIMFGRQPMPQAVEGYKIKHNKSNEDENLNSYN